jgi:hypothetical protein
MANLTAEQLIPWPWAITPLDEYKDICPSSAEILEVFVIVNIAASLLALAAGHRYVVKFITCGFAGGKNSTSWRYMWAVQVGIMLGANAINAAITVNDTRYDSARMPAIGDLVLFYASRPRFSWVLLLSGIIMFDKKGQDWWGASRRSTMISEGVLQIIGLYYKGRTAKFAIESGLMVSRKTDGNPHQTGFLLMAISSQIYLILSLTTVYTIFLGVGGFSNRSGAFMSLASCMAAWIMNWLFLVGYTLVAGIL